MEEIIHLALSHPDGFTPARWRERWLASLREIARTRGLAIPDLDSLPFEELVRQLEAHTCGQVQSFTQAKILVIDGASGTGKNHLGEFLRKEGWEAILRYKDRDPRVGEQDGSDAYFITPALFTKMQEAGEFVGVRGSFGERRAYRRATILDTVRSGKHCFNAEGLSFLPLAAADPVLATIPTFSVFLLPPSLEELLKRMVGRECAGQQFSPGVDLVAFLRGQKVLERLEYGFNDLSASLEGSDPRRRFLADCYVVHDTSQRVLARLGITQE